MKPSKELRLIEDSKSAMRRRLAALPFAEKLRILDELRDRSLALSANPLRRLQSHSTRESRALRFGAVRK
jgi:hypothetical protein